MMLGPQLDSLIVDAESPPAPAKTVKERGADIFIVFFAGAVVYGFFHNGPGPYAESKLSPLDWIFVVVVVFIVIGRYLRIVFYDSRRGVRIFWTGVIFVLLLGGFTNFYYRAGRSVPASALHRSRPLPRSDFRAFGEPISKADALYFAVGTMTTAGAGSLSVKSSEARIAATVQMICDLALFGLGLTAALRD